MTTNPGQNLQENCRKALAFFDHLEIAVYVSDLEFHVWEFFNRLNRRWYRCIDKAIEWVDGRTVRYEMALAITDLKHIEAALRKSEKNGFPS